HGTAPVPAHAFRPDKDRLAAVVPCHGRMLAALACSRSGHRLGPLAALAVEAGPRHLSLRLPGRPDAPLDLRQRETAHRTDIHVPFLDFITLESLPVIPGGQEERVSLLVARGGAIKQVDITVAIVKGPHAAAAADAGSRFRDGFLGGKRL